MTELLPFIIAAFFWAWMTQASTRGKYGVHRQDFANEIAFSLLVMTLVTPVALRYTYNDSPLSSKRQKNICVTWHLAMGAVF